MDKSSAEESSVEEPDLVKEPVEYVEPLEEPVASEKSVESVEPLAEHVASEESVEIRTGSNIFNNCFLNFPVAGSSRAIQSIGYATFKNALYKNISITPRVGGGD